MKKILSWGLMLAAAFTLTNCAKEITNPDQQPETAGYPFEISASVVDTKTVNDGIKTKWVAGDKINLFHAVCDGTDYKNDGAFTISNVDASKFGGSLCETLDVEEEYDWYAFYPYTSALATPKNTTVEINIGTDLVQDGYGSMAHLAGEALPLYGKAIAVPGADMPSIAMSQLASVLAVNVTNNTDAAIVVEEVSFVADGNNISGTFYVDFSGEKVTYKPAQALTTATVTVANPTSLAVGATATVYIPIAPFGGYEGDTMTLTVNDLTKEIFLSKDVDFTAGRIKNLNFSYVVEEEPEPEVPAFEPGEYWIVANGKYAMPITSGTYGYLKVDEVGYTDNVFTISAVEGGYTIQQPDGKYLYMTGSYDSFNVSATAPSDNGHVWTIELNEDGSYKILNVLKQKYIQLDSTYGTYGSYNTVKGTMPNLVPADDATFRPVFSITTYSKTVDFDVTAASFDITSNQSWTVVPGEGVSVDVTSGNGNGTVTMTFAENDTEEAVTYTATVKSEGFEDIVLTVIQAAESVGETTETIVDLTWTLGSNAYDNSSTGTSKQSAKINGVSYTKLLKLGSSKNAGSATITIPAGTTKITYSAVAWKGANCTLQFTVGGTKYTQKIAANVGATGNPTYTITSTSSDNYELAVSAAAATTVTVTTTTNVRALIWDLKAVVVE
jgi:hypothetical protein